MANRKRQLLSIEVKIPSVPAEGIIKANELAEYGVAFSGSRKSADDATVDDVKAEAIRLAAIEDMDERTVAISEVLIDSVKCARELRNLARSFLKLAGGCEIAERQFLKVQDAVAAMMRGQRGKPGLN